MATNKIIKSLTANAYNGTFEAPYKNVSVAGSISTDGNKSLVGINADVKEGNTLIGNVNGYWNGEKMVYSFNGIEDIIQLTTVANAVQAVVEQIATELASEQ